MDEKTFIDTRYLFNEKEKIFDMIKKISDKEDLLDRLKCFEPRFSEIRKILEKMGEVLRIFINNNYFKEQDFEFYFWPGFSTLKNKRVFIWGSKTIDSRTGQNNYFTGIGWDKEGKEFRDCPTTLAYDQVLSSTISENCVFFPGSTHHFRKNQCKDLINRNGKEYLKLRIINSPFDKTKFIKRNVFKSLHVTTDPEFEEDKNSKHTLHIIIPKEKMQISGFIMKECLDDFLKQHNNYSKERGKYLWKWPFDIFPYEEKIKEKIKKGEIESREIVDLCKEYQEKDIDIQTHLYSYWIAKTLGNGYSFSDEKMTNEYKNKLNDLLVKSDRLSLQEKFGFFDRIDLGVKQIDYKKIFFNHWYTLYHEGVTFDEDLGSTMLLTSHQLPPDLLYYISSWIEDIYNNLKLVESKATAEYNTEKMDFRTLYHIQLPYIELFKSFTEEGNNPQCLIPIVEYLRYGLKIARNYSKVEKLQEELEYKKPINVLKVIEESKTIINTLCQNEKILEVFFRIKIGEGSYLQSLASENKIIVIEKEKPVIVETHKESFEMIIHELLFNAIKHSIHDDPGIKIIFESSNDKTEQIICFYNNSKIKYSQESFDEKLKKTNRQGVKIIKKLAKVLNITLSHTIKDNMICTTIKFKKHERK